MMEHRTEESGAASLLLYFLKISQNSICLASSQVDNPIPLGTDPSGDAFVAKVPTDEGSGGDCELWKADYTQTHELDNRRGQLRGNKVDGNYDLTCIHTFELTLSAGDETREKLWFVVYHVTDIHTTVLDGVPNKGEYFISSEVSTELPSPMPIFSLHAVAVSIYILYRRRFKGGG